jgi:lambda family phage portal protein
MLDGPRNWLDRTIGAVSPRWELQRIRTRIAAAALKRHYEAATLGRRTNGWHRPSTDVNAAVGPYAGRLRDVTRELVRNNPYAARALVTIVNHTVGGWGIVAKPAPASPRAAALWAAWAGTTACDADGRYDFAGLQKLVMRTVVESGEALVRKRLRRPEDGLPIPLQLQVLEPDYLDTLKDRLLPNGGRIVQGIELDAIGRRVGYWLFPEHPGASSTMALQSVKVPADQIQHVFRPLRPGQMRGVSWFASSLQRFKDLDEFEDATLMKQRVAACLSVITSGETPLGDADDTKTPGIDYLQPGGIHQVEAGASISVVQPPSVREYPDYVANVLRSIAAGLDLTYEDLTGNYEDLPFSAARMSRNSHWTAVKDWQWNLLIPQFCDPAWRWAMEVAQVFGHVTTQPEAEWTEEPPPMIDPEREGIAYQRLMRNGLISWSGAARERGYDPMTLLGEIADDFQRFDEAGVVLDCDPRRITQAGQAQSNTATGEGSTKIDTDEPADTRALERWLDDLPRRERDLVLAALGGRR